MPTCQHTNTASSPHNSSTLIRLDTVTTHSMWEQEVNLYITLRYTWSFPNDFSWNKSHYSTWQKNCMCIYQHVWPAFPRSTIKAIFKVNEFIFKVMLLCIINNLTSKLRIWAKILKEHVGGKIQEGNMFSIKFCKWNLYILHIKM